MTTRSRPIPLSALRGFEAAARLASFTRAAGELNLTQSAISRQVASLERQIGKTLFKRKTRELELTAAGQRFAEIVRNALRDIDRGVADVRGRQQRQRVTVSTYASMASLVLLPRLAQFATAYPDVDIRIDASDALVDLQRDSVDAALRFCGPAQAPEGAELLAHGEYCAVVSAQLAARMAPLRSPADLGRATLLVIDDGTRSTQRNGWQRWFEHAGAEMPDSARRIIFNYTYQAIEAAIRGEGAALVPAFFVRDALANGALVQPFPALVMRSAESHYLVRNASTAERAHVTAFCRWLVDQFKPSVP